ncbi:MAG TPA: tetratricopeptide repeat protein, partial [bacterium]
MKKSKPIHSIWFVLLALLFWGGCLGQELPEVIQITTHPTPDYQPAVSPDGNWLASVSERSGNADIWIKRLPRGNSVQATVHQADDYEPAWSPDSRKLVFVSKRRDAFGDLWMVKLNLRSGGIPDNEPVQLTSHLGMDRSPCFSPDGRKIVFVSDRSGQPDLWIFDLSTSETQRLTFKGGEEPSWSPDGNWILFTSYRRDPNGDLVLISSKAGKEESVFYPVTSGNAIDGQGRWSPSGMHIVFRRFTMDSDGDGAVTVEDNSTIWQKSMDSQQTDWPNIGIELQITPESERAQHPCFGPGGTLYYTSERGKGRDIWSVPEGGLFKRCTSAEAQYHAVWERFGEATSEEALEYSILGYRRVLDYFPNDTVWCSRALIRMSETYQVLGKPRQARDQAERIVQNYRQQNWETAEAILKLSSFADEPIEARLSRCRTVLEQFPDDPSILAEAWILLGDLYKENRNIMESVSAYGRVLALPRASTNWKAQAQLKIGDLFLSQGQWETARQSYLAVLREYGGIPLWRDRAGQRLINQVQGNLQERIAQYQLVIQQFPSYPSLIAEAQLAIADALKRQNQYERAYGELEQMESIVPGLDWAVAKSKIVQAQLRSLSGDDLKGIFLLEGVIQNYPSLEGGRYALEAKDTLFTLLFRSAERLRSTGDNQLAGVRYRKALDLRFNDVPCHRGWVECLYRAGRLDEAMQEYRTRLRQNPRDPVVLYGLGLALSYQGEKDAGLLEKSNVYLSLSLEENYRLVPPYRTIGFNFEALEKLAEQNQSKRYGWLYRTGKTVVGPLRWAYGLLPFGKAVQKEGYYEKAIQVLSTALELNDERFDPKMEAGLAQNLANNFYNLGEFGFAKAYQYYCLRLSHDTTFTNLIESASFYERIGHCALYIQEYESAAAYLRRAVQTYADLGREEESLLSMRRLAMLHYQAGQYGDAVQVYQALATRDEKANRLNELELDYRNIAFNNHMVGEDEEALRYALQAERIFRTWNIPQKPPKKDKVRIELFGFSLPIPFTGIKEIGGALAEGFTLADEAAMVWGLVSRSQEALKRHDEAIATEQKRLSLFRNRKDGFAERICLNRLG